MLVGVSYSALTESCRLAGTKPHAARDFMRVLRVLYHTGGRIEHLEAFLRVGDSRTLHALWERAGLLGRTPQAVLSLDDYLRAQRFIELDSPALQAIKVLLAKTRRDSPRS